MFHLTLKRALRLRLFTFRMPALTSQHRLLRRLLGLRISVFAMRAAIAFARIDQAFAAGVAALIEMLGIEGMGGHARLR